MAGKRVKKTSSKKPVKRKVAKKVSRAHSKVAKKSVSKPAKVMKKSGRVRSTKNKIMLILTKLIFFIVLSLVSFLSYYFLVNDLLRNLFLMLTIIFSFISVGFLIALLVFVFLRVMRK